VSTKLFFKRGAAHHEPFVWIYFQPMGCIHKRPTIARWASSPSTKLWGSVEIINPLSPLKTAYQSYQLNIQQLIIHVLFSTD
jgi:hypothetical protein